MSTFTSISAMLRLIALPALVLAMLEPPGLIKHVDLDNQRVTLVCAHDGCFPGKLAVFVELQTRGVHVAKCIRGNARWVLNQEKGQQFTTVVVCALNGSSSWSNIVVAEAATGQNETTGSDNATGIPFPTGSTQSPVFTTLTPADCKYPHTWELSFGERIDISINVIALLGILGVVVAFFVWNRFIRNTNTNTVSPPPKPPRRNRSEGHELPEGQVPEMFEEEQM